MSQILALYMGSLILRSIGIAAIAGLCTWKIRNVAMRHAVWVAVLSSMLLMPVVDYLMPASWVPARIQRIAAEQPVTFRIPSARTASVPQTPATAPTAMALPNRPSPVNLWNVAATLYGLVALAMFARLAMGYRKLRSLRRTGRTIGSPVWQGIVASHRTRLPVLLESEAIQVPMTVGFVRPAVFLPADWKTWDDWKLRAVLFHEIAHVRRCDWAIAAIAATSKCAYWLNPLSWFLERKLSHLAEQASDDASLCRTEDATRYAEILLEFAAATQNGGRLMKGGVAMAQRNMKTRIERVLGKPQSGAGIVRIAGWILVMMAAAPVIYSAAALQVPSEPAPAPKLTYVAEFGRNPAPQAPATRQQASATPALATLQAVQQNSQYPASDPQIRYEQIEAEYQKVRRSVEATEQTFQTLQKYNQAFAGPTPGPQNTSDREATDLLREELVRAQTQLRARQAEVEMRKSEVAQQEQQLVNKSSPPERQLEQLKASYAALASSQAEFASLSRLMEEKQLASSSIERTESKSKNRIFVMGKVKTAGAYEFDEPLTVLQALALAGGIHEFARMDAITITRMSGNTSILFRFTYSEVIRGVNPSQNIYLANGDVVVVP